MVNSYFYLRSTSCRVPLDCELSSDSRLLCLHIICELFADAKSYIPFFCRDVRRDRECVMCMYEEVSVVFLPCAHQVVCAGCDEVHKNHGISNCPSCRTPIQQRIRVYGPS